MAQLICEICKVSFFPVWDDTNISISPVMCNACLFSGDEEVVDRTADDPIDYDDHSPEI